MRKEITFFFGLKITFFQVLVKTTFQNVIVRTHKIFEILCAMPFAQNILHVIYTVRLKLTSSLALGPT
jgi:hypothetical protein